MPAPYDSILTTVLESPFFGPTTASGLGALGAAAPVVLPLGVGAALAPGLIENDPTTYNALFGQQMGPWMRAVHLVSPYVPMLMGARQGKPTTVQANPAAAPRGAATPSASPRTRGAATPPPVTPQPTPVPTPPQFPTGPQRNIVKGLALAGAATMARPILYGDVGAALPAIGQRIGRDAQAVGAAMGQVAAGDNPILRMYARPMAGLMAPIPPVGAAPTITPLPAPLPAIAPTSAPSRQSSRLTYREEVAAMPDGSVFEIEGVGLVQRRGDMVYPVAPTPKMPPLPTPTPVPTPARQRAYRSGF